MPLTGNFDLYYLIVELVFGNLLSAFLGIALALLIIGIITKMSMITIAYIEILFAITYCSLWWGGIAILIGFIGTGFYLWWAWSKWVKESAG